MFFRVFSEFKSPNRGSFDLTQPMVSRDTDFASPKCQWGLRLLVPLNSIICSGCSVPCRSAICCVEDLDGGIVLGWTIAFRAGHVDIIRFLALGPLGFMLARS